MRRFFRIIAGISVIFFLYVILVLGIQFLYILKSPQGKRIDLKKNTNSAVLVIDVQNKLTFTDNAAKASKYRVPAFIKNLNLALNKLSGSEIIYIRQEFPQNSFLSFILPTFPEEGEPGTAINPAVYSDGLKIFTKSRADAFSNPSLQQHLESKKIGILYITGLAAEACVNSTIKGATARGYRVIVIKEAVLSMHGGQPGIERLQKYRSLGAEIISVSDIK